MSHVFISYVHENEPLVRMLISELNRHNIQVWVDKDNISPGTRWQDAIRNAIRDGDYFFACLSKEYEDKKTYMNEELIIAIEELRQRPRTKAWFIPVLLTKTEIPDIPIGAGETLRSIQAVMLYDDNWEIGIKKLISMVRLPIKSITEQQTKKSILRPGELHLEDRLALFFERNNMRKYFLYDPGYPKVAIQHYGDVKYDFYNLIKSLPKDNILKYLLKQTGVKKPEFGKNGNDREGVLYERIARDLARDALNEIPGLKPPSTDYPDGHQAGDMILVPKGTFLYGDNKFTYMIDYDYEIDMFPVTNKQYREFIDNAGYLDKKFSTCTISLSSLLRHPSKRKRTMLYPLDCCVVKRDRT